MVQPTSWLIHDLIKLCLWYGNLECTCFEFTFVKMCTLISYMIFNFVIAIIFRYLICLYCGLMKLKFYVGTFSWLRPPHETEKQNSKWRDFQPWQGWLLESVMQVCGKQYSKWKFFQPWQGWLSKSVMQVCGKQHSKLRDFQPWHGWLSKSIMQICVITCIRMDILTITSINIEFVVFTV